MSIAYRTLIGCSLTYTHQSVFQMCRSRHFLGQLDVLLSETFIKMWLQWEYVQLQKVLTRRWKPSL